MPGSRSSTICIGLELPPPARIVPSGRSSRKTVCSQILGGEGHRLYHEIQMAARRRISSVILTMWSACDTHYDLIVDDSISRVCGAGLT